MMQSLAAEVEREVAVVERWAIAASRCAIRSLRPVSRSSPIVIRSSAAATVKFRSPISAGCSARAACMDSVLQAVPGAACRHVQSAVDVAPELRIGTHAVAGHAARIPARRRYPRCVFPDRRQHAAGSTHRQALPARHCRDRQVGNRRHDVDKQVRFRRAGARPARRSAAHRPATASPDASPGTGAMAGRIARAPPSPSRPTPNGAAVGARADRPVVAVSPARGRIALASAPKRRPPTSSSADTSCNTSSPPARCEIR